MEAAEDEIAHPAFANLFVRAREEREQGCVIFSRKHRGEGASFFAVGGLTPRRGWQALSSREQIFAACRRGGDFSAIHRASWDDGVLKTPLDPAAAIRIPLTLEDLSLIHI